MKFAVIKVPGEEPLTAETRFPSAIEIRTASAGRVEDVGSGGNPIFASGYEVISSEDQFLWCYVTGIAYPAVAGYLASEHPGVDRRGGNNLSFGLVFSGLHEAIRRRRTFCTSSSWLDVPRRITGGAGILSREGLADSAPGPISGAN